MNRLLPALAVVGLALLLVIPAAVAQELTADDYIQYFKPLEGSWKKTTESDGTVLHSTWRLRLSRTKTCFLSYEEGGGLPAMQTVDGYDPVAKKWTVAAFDAAGSFFLLTVHVANITKGKHLTKEVIGSSKFTIFKEDGTTTTMTSQLSCLECSDNRVVLLWSDTKDQAQPRPSLKWTFDRQPEARQLSPNVTGVQPDVAQGLTADDYVQLWKPLAGAWKGVVESDGKAIESTWRTRLAPHQKCFVAYGTGGGFPATQTIDGFDPVTKKWTVVGFDADGTFSIDTCQLSDMQKGKRVGKGLIGNGEVKRFSKDGKATTITYKLSCTDFSDNRAAFVWSDRKENGQPKPDEKWTAERQPEKERKTRQ